MCIPFFRIHCQSLEITLPSFQMAGDEALGNENYEHALELYHLSKVIILSNILTSELNEVLEWLVTICRMCTCKPTIIG